MPVTASRKARHLAPYVAALALAPALAVATAAPATADLGPIDLPAGLACASFDLRVAGTGDKRIMREFTDENGNVVRLLSAGKGFDLTFTNLNSGESLSFPSNGSVERTALNADGTRTVQATGHNVVILFPTDEPAGPTTTLYTGQLVYTIDANGDFHVQKTTGQTTDICAALLA
jgi:hypothetical protein